MKKERPSLQLGDVHRVVMSDRRHGFSFEVGRCDVIFTPTEGDPGRLRVILYSHAQTAEPHLKIIRRQAWNELDAGSPGTLTISLGKLLWGRLYPIQSIHPQRRVDWKNFLREIRCQFGRQIDQETGRPYLAGDALEHLQSLGEQVSKREMPSLREVKKFVQFNPQLLPDRSQITRARAKLNKIAARLVELEQGVFRNERFRGRNLTRNEQVTFDKYLRRHTDRLMIREGIDPTMKAHLTLLSHAELTSFLGGLARRIRQELPPRYLSRFDHKVFTLMHVPRIPVMYDDGSFDLPLYQCHVFKSALEFISGVGTRKKAEVFLLPDLLTALRDGLGAHPAGDRAVQIAVGFARTYQSWTVLVRAEERESKAAKSSPEVPGLST